MRKNTTGKIEPSKQFLLEEKLTFQRRIVSIIEEHYISKYTFNPKGVRDKSLQPSQSA